MDRLTTIRRFDSTAVGIICGIAASLFWAAGFVAVRYGLTIGFSPTDLMIHRYMWSGLAFIPFVIHASGGDLNGVGWGRGILLSVLGGPVFAILGYTGFLLVPLGPATPWFEQADAQSIILLAGRQWVAPWVADALERRPDYSQLRTCYSTRESYCRRIPSRTLLSRLLSAA